MNVTRSTLALALSLVASTSFADTFNGTLDLSGGNVHFGRDNAVSVFTDTYAFNINVPGFLFSAVAGSASPDADHDLDFTSLVINDSSNNLVATFQGNRGTDANESYFLPSMPLAAGAYTLVITGVNTPGQASYSGNISIAAIPEPETYALMWAGLMVVGFVARRRS